MSTTTTRGGRTSGTTRVPKAEITGFHGYLLKRFSRKLLGDVPEPAEVMWHKRAGWLKKTAMERREFGDARRDRDEDETPRSIRGMSGKARRHRGR